MPSFSLGKGTLLGVGYIRVEADTAAAESKLSGLGKGLAIGATGFAALAAAGVASVKMASDFNNEMLKVRTQAGGSAADVKTLSTQILNMKNVQQSPMQLAEAMYHLKSVGLDNVTAMKDLKVASDLAAVGGSNLEATTNALAGAWRSGIKGAQDMGMAAASVNAIIGAGNMRMEDFVAAIGTGILPSARTFGLSLNQVGSALALMTDEGIPAVDAATRLRMSFSLLGAPSGAADKWLKKIGLTGLDLATAMRGPDGLIGAIQLLKDHLDASGLSAAQQAQVLSRAFGGGRSNSAILTMLNNLSTLKLKQDQVNTSMGKLPAAIAAQQQTLSAKIAILKNNLDEIGIKVGETLIGPVTAFVSFLSGIALPALNNFASALSKPLAGVGQAVSGLAASGFFQSLMGTGSKTFAAGTHPGTASAPARVSLRGQSHDVAPTQPAAPSGLAQAGVTLHTVFLDLAKTLGDVATAASNLWTAIAPFIAFLAKTGLGTIQLFGSILANQVGPALVAVTGFIKDNSGWLKILLIAYLTPLAAKMAVMSVIKPITWFSDLTKDIVNFPVSQISSIKQTFTDLTGKVSGFKAPGGGLDDLRLRLWSVGGALKTGAGNALTFGKNVGGAVKTFASGAWGTASGAFQNLSLGLKMAASSALDLAGNAGKALGTMIATGWSKAVQGIKDLTTATKLEALAIWDVTTKKLAEWAVDAKDLIVKGAIAVKDLAIAAAEGVWAGVQWILDAAMDANPIGLIVIGIAALVTAIVLIATKTTWFQTTWNAVWGFVKTVALGVWNFLTTGLGQLTLLLLGPIGVLALLALHWNTVWGVIKDVALGTWHFLDQYLFQPLEAAFNFLWSNVVQPVIKFIVDSFLGAAGAIVNGAATMFGWVPGIGGMLKGAAKAFNDFAAGVNASLDGIQPKTVPVTISFNGVPEGQITGHSYTSTTGFSYASGGQIPMSVGTPGKDSVHVMAMPGEFIVNTRATQQNLGLLRKINAGQLKGYASGGMVGFDGAVQSDMKQAARTDISRQTTRIVSAYVKANNAYWANLGTQYGGSIPSGAHLSIINAALAAAGVPPPGTLGQWQGGLNTLIGRESGWNPNAINLTDSNAAAGDPSRGLAQTIMSTFLAYVPGSLKNLGIYNPIANVAAAIRYIVATYGSIANVQQANPNLPPKGYDSGGLAMGAGMLPKFTPRPERVLSPRQTAAFETLVASLDRRTGPGGGAAQPLELHVHFNGPVGSRRELEDWLIQALTNAKRNNRLKGLVG